MKNLEKKVIGKIHFEGEVDITDPCYDKDVWCRLNHIPIEDGDYEAVIWRNERRVAILGIYLNGKVPKEDDMDYFGNIGVDSGMAGVVRSGTELDDNAWGEFCDDIFGNRSQGWIRSWGVVSESGFGDSEYDVFLLKKDGKAVAIEIRFF